MVKLKANATSAPKKKPKIVGRKLKRNLGASWAYLLRRNHKRKWDDQRLLEWIQREFPNRQHRYTAATWRSYYNHGRISANGKPTYKPPKKISYAYDVHGRKKKRQKGRPRYE